MHFPKWLNRLLLAMGLISSLIVAGWIITTAPHFAEVLRGFQIEITVLGQLFVRFYPAVVALPIVVLICWKFWPYPAFSAVVAAGVGLLGAGILAILYLLAMYRPIYELGNNF